MKRFITIIVFVILFTPLQIRAEEPSLDLSPASWIWYPSNRTLSNTMLMFRKEFSLDKVPDKVDGWILADSRYLLYVNGKRVQWGPAPSDPRWPEADPLDIREYLKEGKNVIACQVLYYGLGDGTSPIGKPGFICKLELGKESIVSDDTWDVAIARSWRPGQYKRYYQRAFQEEFNANLYAEGWETLDYKTDREWLKAMKMEGRADRSQLSTNYPEYAQDYRASNRAESRIRPRSVPTLDEYYVPVAKLTENMWINWKMNPANYFEMNTPVGYEVDRTPCVAEESDGVWTVTSSGDDRGAILTFEFAEQIVGFPSFTIEAPENTTIELLTHEAHEIGGPALLNTHFNAWSRYICKEGENRFEAFDYEGLRWIQLHIHNFKGTVKIKDVGARRRIFPWKHKPEIKMADKTLEKLMYATVNTLNNCAQDFIVDGMGRERQQYSGDCGHQIVPIFTTFGETRLPRRYLVTFSQGMSTEGYFMDCWPAYDRLARVMQKQIGLSNWGPLLDHGVGFGFDNYKYYLYTGDATYLDETLPRLIKSYEYLRSIAGAEDGLLPVENLGIPSVWIDHHAFKKNRHKILAFNLYIAAMCKDALVPLCEAAGYDQGKIQEILDFSESLHQACVKKFWAADRKVFVCNLPWEKEEGETRYDDRSLATAILYNQCPDGETERSAEILAGVPSDMGLSYPCNAIWRLWALVKARRMDVVVDDLHNRWAKMESVELNNTLAEDWHSKPDGRDQWSHCAIAPLIMLHEGIAGIQPLTPGYDRMEIAPQFAGLGDMSFAVQTVKGTVDFESTGKLGNRRVKINVPAGTTAELVLHESEKVKLPEIAHDTKTKTRRYKVDGGTKLDLRLRYM